MAQLFFSKKHNIEYGILNFENEILEASDRAYEAVAERWGRVVGPSSAKCRDVCTYLFRDLEKRGRDVNYIVAESNQQDCPIHTFIILHEDVNRWLIDPTYQQYVPKSDRKTLPPVMICSLTTPESLRAHLRGHAISENFFPVWETRIF